MLKIFDRIALLVRADAHGVMDQLEEESLLLKQHLRDAELEVNRKRAELDVRVEESRHLEAAEAELERKETELEADVDLALGGEDEELARYAIRRLLVVQQSRKEMRARYHVVRTEREELAGRLRSQEAELEILRARVQERLERSRRLKTDPSRAPAIAEQDVDLELLRRAGARAAKGAGSTGAGEGTR